MCKTTNKSALRLIEWIKYVFMSSFDVRNFVSWARLSFYTFWLKTLFFFLYRLKLQSELYGQPVFRQLLSDRERILLQPCVLQEVLLRVVYACRSAASRQRRSAELTIHRQHDQASQERSSQQTPEFELVLSYAFTASKTTRTTRLVAAL